MKSERHKKANTAKTSRRVFELKEELDYWLSGEGRSEEEQRSDAIRVISGEPGSGKSSFAKMYAHRRMSLGDRVLYVPLHRLNVNGEFGEEIDVFCNESENCPTALMSGDSQEPHLLIILDGLDELAKQGAIGATIANEFIHEVTRNVLSRNSSMLRIQAIVSGRPIAIQDVSDKFRKPGQILNILPYFTRQSNDSFIGQTELLRRDMRQEWWKIYGELTGHPYDGLPTELGGNELWDLTTQPLLNLLLAIVYKHGAPSESDSGIDFSGKINRNMIYEVLLERVYDRDWDTSKSHKALGDLDLVEFKSLLEEMALTAWHGTERTTTVTALRKQCEKSFLKDVLEKYEQKCEDGVSSLFTAFYFRKSAKVDGPEPTFEFTHKSFGEYLTGMRAVDALSEIDGQLHARAVQRRRVNTFCDEDALLAWLAIFGPNTISHDLREYIENEIDREFEIGEANFESWQATLGKLITVAVQQGMPCERHAEGATFKAMQHHSGNAGFALLYFHSLIAMKTGQLTKIEWSAPRSAESFLHGIGFSRANTYLNHLDFNGQNFGHVSFARGNISNSSFIDAEFSQTSFCQANCSNTDFTDANLHGVDLRSANFQNSKLGFVGTVSWHTPGYDDVSYSSNISETDFTQCTIEFIEGSGIPAFLPDGTEPPEGWRIVDGGFTK